MDPLILPDRPHEACGVFGIFGPEEQAAYHTYTGLQALQHRGQESAGIAVSNGVSIDIHRGMGMVRDALPLDELSKLTGYIAIGHTRYSTAGTSSLEEAQPMLESDARETFAISYNGHIVNVSALRKELRALGWTTTTRSDTEVIGKLFAAVGTGSYVDRAHMVMSRLIGAYCLLVMTPRTLIAMRDPLGVRPLSIGRLGEHWAVASETCAIAAIGAENIRDVHPGEVVLIDALGDRGLHSYMPSSPYQPAPCLFEQIYFAHQDSLLGGHLVYATRQRMGKALAREFRVDADSVVGVPETALPAAAGYAASCGLPLLPAILANRSPGRSFIQPEKYLQQRVASAKYSVIPDLVQGKRIVLIDDSLVRGTTLQLLVARLRAAGASQVHVGVTSPPFRFPCYLGINVKTTQELLTSKVTDLTQLASYLGADSLHFLSLDPLIRSARLKRSQCCTGCFTGHYPVPNTALFMVHESKEHSNKPTMPRRR